jgi:hypothetical protein
MKKSAGRLINKISDVVLSAWPGRKLRRIETEIARMERIIEKETMISSPKQDVIKNAEIVLLKLNGDKTKSRKKSRHTI